MTVKTVAIRIDSDLWKNVKLHCIKNNLALSDFVQDLIERELERNQQKEGGEVN